MTDENSRLRQLESQLQLLTEDFEREMRARGFDPEQAENAALPSHLARLYLERQSLLDEIEGIKRGLEQ